MELLKGVLGDYRALWALAFVGICVLVALDKVKAETLEYMLFALFGAASSSALPKKE